MSDAPAAPSHQESPRNITISIDGVSQKRVKDGSQTFKPENQKTFFRNGGIVVEEEAEIYVLALAASLRHFSYQSEKRPDSLCSIERFSLKPC